jgi:flagellar basal body-associated protein FliL
MFASYILEFFSTKSKNALLSAGEKEVKRLLLERLNSQLSLGQVAAIYFDDYIFLD